jgi:transcriptional regulator with XRE-family HTH domain
MQHSDLSPEALFGARVRALRVEIGISLASLAASVLDTAGAAMTPSELAALESGQRPIRLNEAVALAAVLDMTVEEMLRPVPPPAEQLRRAQEAVGRASVRMAEARAEYEFAKTHLHGLQISGTDTGNGGIANAAHPPPVQLTAITHNISNGGSDGLHLAQREGPAAAG